MFKSLKSNNSGFSIVEIMIVLIVVGLVTTGVLLAAQTLQRNARNDARDRDVQLIGTAIADYAAANNGNLDGGNTAIVSGTTFLNDLNLTHYDSNNTNVSVTQIATPVADDTTEADAAVSRFAVRGNGGATNPVDIDSTDDDLPNTDNVHIWVGYQCPELQSNIADGTGHTKYEAPADKIYDEVTKRAFIIVYRHEGAGPAALRCVDFGS